MDSEDITVRKLFSDRRQFLVPFYQRAYVWTEDDQWDQLWGDILEKAEVRLEGKEPPPHFLGAVVLDPQSKRGLMGVETQHIIDGQQRLTTLQYILKATRLAFEESSLERYCHIVDEVLVNQNPDTMLDPNVERFKVWPTFRDRELYLSAMTVDSVGQLIDRFPDRFTKQRKPRKYGAVIPSCDAVWYFTNRISSWLAESNDGEVDARADALLTAILADIKLVSIVLGEADDAQVIFETLNGRGAKLNATDLIRNFIFMRAEHNKEDSKALYDSYWQAFEDSNWSAEVRRGRLKRPRLEWFVHASLQAYTGVEVDLGRLYFEYRRFALDGKESLTAEQQLKVLSMNSGPYIEISTGIGESSAAIFGRRMGLFDVTTSDPLALAIATSDLSQSVQATMYGLIESYIVRRAVCGLTTKNYNYVFLSLLRHLHKEGFNAESLRNALGSLQGEATRWPKDDEFTRTLISSSLFPGVLDSAKMRAILGAIEVELRSSARIEDREARSLSGLDVDHIMPKSWFEYWPLDCEATITREQVSAIELKTLMGEEMTDIESRIVEREKRIRVLGNLTLLDLSVNREAQNKDFKRKRDLLIKNTVLRLNIPLIAMESWNEEAIEARGRELAAVALRVWPRGDAANEA